MSITRKSLGDAVHTLADSSSPVLFCDTCAFLDLIRLPFRKSQPSTVASYLATADSVLKAVRTGDISLATPYLVCEEWHDNAQNVLSETKKHLSVTFSRWLFYAAFLLKYSSGYPCFGNMLSYNRFLSNLR